jgi:hypothetical protein
MAFCWREPDTDLYTAGICQRCEAGHSDEKLSEMVQQEVFSDRVARLRSIEEVSDEMEGQGLARNDRRRSDHRIKAAPTHSQRATMC